MSRILTWLNALGTTAKTILGLATFASAVAVFATEGGSTGQIIALGCVLLFIIVGIFTWCSTSSSSKTSAESPPGTNDSTAVETPTVTSRQGIVATRGSTVRIGTLTTRNLNESINVDASEVSVRKADIQ